MDVKERVIFFLKGICMGLADIIPGVSGGTIALITGIYERLIFAIKSIDVKIPLHLLRGDLREARNSITKIDFELLLPLAGGIGVAFLIASGGIKFALESFPAATNSFFFGLILSSAVFIYRRIGVKNLRHLAAGIGGFLFGFLIVSLEKIGLIHSPLMIFASGFVAICAMILPGVSGAFILFVLGQYDFMLGALQNFDLLFIFLFLIGAALGLLVFSRALSYLLKRWEASVLAFLTGLMVGALKLPLENVVFVNRLHPELFFTWDITSIGLVLTMGALGMFLVTLLKTKS